jgi:hypothetical protein
MSNFRNSYQKDKRKGVRTPVLELKQDDTEDYLIIDPEEYDLENGKIKRKSGKSNPVVPLLSLSSEDSPNEKNLTPSGISVFKSPREFIKSALKRFSTTSTGSPVTTPKNALVQKKKEDSPQLIQYTVLYWDKEMQREQEDVLILPNRYRVIKVAGKGAYGLVV